MHKKIPGALLCVSAAAFLIAAPVDAASADAPMRAKDREGGAFGAVIAVPEEMVTRLIVKSRQGSEKLRRELHGLDASALSRVANAPLKVERPMSGGAHVINLERPLRLSDARGIAARLMRDPDVEMAEPDRIMRIATTLPTDPGYLNQWHYFAPNGLDNKGGANLPAAWDITKGVPAVAVAVIDTGYRQHIDLGTVLPGYDFISSAADARDGDGRDADAQDEGTYGTAAECSTAANVNSSWHGTHVAGTIAALMDNGAGGTGIAPQVKILPVRVLGKCGTGFTSDIIDGMRWAAGLAVPGVPANANPAQVLNLSLGGAGACSASMQSAVTAIVNAGKLIMAAAGNGGSTAIISPANCAGVMAITAHAIDGDNAYYSDIGHSVALSAPGGGCGFLSYNQGTFACSGLNPRVYSLFNDSQTTPGADSYASYQGTSMASPHAAGVAALMLSQNAALTSAQIQSYLQSSARIHPASTTCTLARYTGMCGSGLLDAEGALKQVIDLAPIVSLTNAYQVVAPNASVALSGITSVAPGTGRSIVSYGWIQESGAAVGAMAGTNTDTATFSAPTTGVYSFKLTVTDSAGKVGSAIATVRVNSPPVPDAIAAQIVAVGGTLGFNVTATDADGDAMTFHAVSLPSGATLSSAGVFSWPNAGPAGTYSLTYYARDADASGATGSVAITVTGTALLASSSSGGGGGSLDVASLLALVLLAVGLRMRRKLMRPAPH